MPNFNKFETSIVNIADTQINPATDEKLDSIIDGLTALKNLKFFDTGNSTDTNLGVDGVFQGQWIDVSNYVGAIITLRIDQDAAVNGLEIQSSTNGVDVAHTHIFSPLANTPEGHHYPTTLDAQYLRVQYTNGGVAQTDFELDTVLFKNMPEDSHVHPVEFEIDSDHPSSITRSILVARNSAGEYANIERTSGGNLKVAVEEVEPAVTEELGLYPAGTGSNGAVTLTSADTAYAVPASAPSGSYKVTLQNNSDTDIYVGYQNTAANGIKLEPGDSAGDKLGSGQQLYAYCGTAGKVITYTTKLVN